MPPHNLTAEQQAEIAAKRAAREAKRAAIAAGLIEPSEQQNDAERERSKVLQRDWISNRAFKSGIEGGGEVGKGMRIISWNVSFARAPFTAQTSLEHRRSR
jgi:hypothetical protein